MTTSLTNDDFQLWVFNMNEELEWLGKMLPAELTARLNYSVESLVLLESWILQRYESIENIKRATESQLTDALARYVGETFRKHIGGHWDIDLENKQNAYYGLPVITGFEERPTPVCPLTLITTSTDRRTGTFINGVLERLVKN